MKHTLEFREICKSFAGVRVLDRVSFSVEGGEVLALVGENGAGKSTLLKILNGDYQQTSGSYLLDGQERHFSSPQEAIAAGIGLIYQERQMFPDLSVAENIFVGNLPIRGGRVDFPALNRMARELIAEFGLPLRPGDKVRDLSVAMQQMVEIMKAYSRRPKVLAFDEPTACLSDKEAQVLFTLIDRLREKGLIVIYVSHRMNEIFRLASKIVVLKDGEFIAEHRAADTDENRLVSEMVGRPVGGMFSGLVRAEPSGEEILRVRGLTGRGFAGVGFSLRRGEILGFFGLVGAGRTEVMLALFGAVPAEAGEIELRGKPCRIRRTRDAIDQKIAYCPEDRKQQGILPLRPVRDNISVVVLRGLCRGPFISSRRENAFARDYVEEFRIKTSSIEKPIYQLSGGNQQKALLARWLSAKPEILILDEPTKGIDVGAKAEIYRMICDVAAQGVAVILVSSELPEIIGLSDRIVVMRNQRVAGELDGRTATEEQVLRYAMLDNREGTT